MRRLFTSIRTRELVAVRFEPVIPDLWAESSGSDSLKLAAGSRQLPARAA
jgi:hypothetical protein